MTADARDHQLQKQAEELYEEYVKPLEADHWGKFIAVGADGQTVMGKALHEVSERALDTLGRGSFLFKEGEVALGKWR